MPTSQSVIHVCASDRVADVPVSFPVDVLARDQKDESAAAVFWKAGVLLHTQYHSRSEFDCHHGSQDLDQSYSQLYGVNPFRL